jgi:nitrogen-specific signal transduction histidine kinase
MDNVPARVAYIDQESRFRFLNRHNEEWLSESRKDLTGRTIAEVVGDARARQLQPLMNRVFSGDDLDRAAAGAAERRTAVGVDSLRA